MTPHTPSTETDARRQALNAADQALSIEERVRPGYRDFEPSNVMLTASGAAPSAFFLSLFPRLAPWRTVHCINTGLHFPTSPLEYKERRTKRYALKVIGVRAEKEKHAFTAKEQSHPADPNLTRNEAHRLGVLHCEV